MVGQSVSTIFKKVFSSYSAPLSQWTTPPPPFLKGGYVPESIFQFPFSEFGKFSYGRQFEDILWDIFFSLTWFFFNRHVSHLFKYLLTDLSINLGEYFFYCKMTYSFSRSKRKPFHVLFKQKVQFSWGRSCT